jgi:uncharacterized delta-60 repeat protein
MVKKKFECTCGKTSRIAQQALREQPRVEATNSVLQRMAAAILFLLAAQLPAYAVNDKGAMTSRVPSGSSAIVPLEPQTVDAGSPGTLDNSFNGRGYISSLPLAPGTAHAIASALALQTDGKIVVAGQCLNNGSNYAVCLARLNPDSSLDTSFDGPDASGTGVGSGRGRFLLPIGSPDQSVGPPILSMLPEGKIVVAVNCRDAENASYDRFCAARLNANGSFDVSFDGPGPDGVGTGSGRGRFVLPNLGAGVNDLSAITTDVAGRLLLVGRCPGAQSAYGFCLTRLQRNGSFDTSFDGPDANETGTGNGNGRFVLPLLDVNASDRAIERAIAVTLQADGKILIAGLCIDGLNEMRMCVVRLHDDGSFDRSFAYQALGGRAIFGSNSAVRSIVAQPDGKIAVGGNCTDPQSGLRQICVARLRENGRPDERMAPVAGSPVLLVSENPLEQSMLEKVLLQADGRLLVAGTCEPDAASLFCIARLSADDVSYDESFGAGGGVPRDKTRFRFDANLTNRLADAVVQSDGKVLMLGNCAQAASSPSTAQTPCLARIHGGASAGRECSLDIDGDGRVSALTDGLINTRIALGLTGDAVTNGVRFAVNAQRSNWPSIRNYLVSRCEMKLP